MAETFLANIQGIELGETEYAVITGELENAHVHSAVQSQVVIPAYPDLICGHSYGITMSSKCITTPLKWYNCSGMYLHYDGL